MGDVGDVLGGDSAFTGGDYRAFTIRERDDGCAELDRFQGSVLGDVAGARDSDALALERFFTARGILDHVLNVLRQKLEFVKIE